MTSLCPEICSNALDLGVYVRTWNGNVLPCVQIVLKDWHPELAIPLKVNVEGIVTLLLLETYRSWKFVSELRKSNHNPPLFISNFHSKTVHSGLIVIPLLNVLRRSCLHRLANAVTKVSQRWLLAGFSRSVVNLVFDRELEEKVLRDCFQEVANLAVNTSFLQGIV